MAWVVDACEVDRGGEGKITGLDLQPGLPWTISALKARATERPALGILHPHERTTSRCLIEHKVSPVCQWLFGARIIRVPTQGRLAQW
jgi:hypothetical protein